MAWVREAHDRKTVRRSATVSCQAVAEEGFRLLGLRTLDLSERGALVESAADVRVGEPVLLSFRVPKGTSWIDAEAKVARVIRGHRSSDKARAVALEFTRIDPTDQALLAGALRRIAPSVPARGIRKDYAGEVRDIASPRAS